MFGPDRNAPLALKFIAVHHALGDVSVGTEDMRRPKDAVDQGGLPVIDMGDNGHVSNLVDGGHAPGHPHWLAIPGSTPESQKKRPRILSRSTALKQIAHCPGLPGSHQPAAAAAVTHPFTLVLEGGPLVRPKQ